MLYDVADTILVPVVQLALLPYFTFILIVSLAAFRGRVTGDKTECVGNGGRLERRFLVVIPAHNEEEGIARTVRRCLEIDYPAKLFDVLVIADNCSDDTAARAKEARARVVIRSDETRKSKGYAIEFLVGRLRETGEFNRLDAIVIVDADTTAHPSLLRVFDRGLGAGQEWIQCYDSVGNGDRSWRTRLMAYGFSLMNGVTLQGQTALGLSAGLRGNGMCLSTRGLERVPWQVHGLAEDLEYSWEVRSAGGRIAFDREGIVYATMLASGGQALENQRRRWENGRRELRRKMLWPILRSPHLKPVDKIASFLELSMPTAASLGAAFLALSLALAFRVPAMIASRGYGYLTLIGTCHSIATLAMLVQLLSPFLLSFLPWRFALSLFYFPYYACWKFLVALRGRPTDWVRTDREPLHRTP
jgi:cellulose synthase/poly-beta-1,6-N-acetylglucosamine synthase-like glycosyltransferase